jgi:hypothetical protein
MAQIVEGHVGVTGSSQDLVQQSRPLAHKIRLTDFFDRLNSFVSQNVRSDSDVRR